MLTYREFLNALRDLDHETRARKLDELDTLKRLRGFAGAAAPVTDADVENEKDLLAEMSRGDMPGKIGDGTLLRDVFQFVKENPLILLLLK